MSPIPYSSDYAFGDDPNFPPALDVVLGHEGGFVDDPDDPGGATKYGVSLRYLTRLGEIATELAGAFDIDGDGDIDADDVRLLSREDAARLYWSRFWRPYGYGRMSLPIATHVFDHAVNAGPVAAHRVLQRACRAAGHAVAEDGVLGPRTVAAAYAAGTETLRAAVRAERAGYYRALIAVRPRLGKYRNGWLRRAYR